MSRNSVLKTLADLQRQMRDEYQYATAPPMPPTIVKATGIKFGIRVQWDVVSGVDGYRVAAMTSTVLDLDAPQKLYTVNGESQLEYIETVGDVATTRSYSVQSFKRQFSGEVLYSDWVYPLASATSKAAAGAADSAPPNPPCPPPSPETSGDSGDPGGVPMFEA